MDRALIFRLRVYLVLSAILVMIAPMGWAQSVTTGTVSGTVFLPDGTATAGATVVLEGPALAAGQRTMVSGEGGKFVFLSVPPGTYTVTTTLASFNTDKVENVALNAGSSIALTINLEIAASTGEIIVTSEAPIVDTRSSNIDTTFNEGLLDVVPTARNTFYDLSLTAAGMSSVGADESWLPSASAYGSAGNENIFLVDGVNTTNPRGASWGSLVQVNYDTVQEVKVLSLGSKAEYGSYSGAAVDVLTKTGGNEFHGTASYYTQLGDAGDNYTTDFGSDWLYVDPADDITTEPVDNTELSLTLGGPILKDKLWFYAGYNTRDAETDTPLWIPLDVYTSDLYDLKLTADFAAAHRLWAGYHYEDNKASNVTWGPTWDPTMRYESPTENDTWTFQYQWVATDTNLVGFKYLGFSTDVIPSTPSEVGHPGYINWWKWTGGQSIGVNGDFPYVEGTQNSRDTFQADFTHYAEDWAGSHEIKFGAQYTDASGDWMGGYFQGYANFAYPYPWGYSYEYMRDAWWHCDATWCVAPTDNVYVPFYNNQVHRNPWLTAREAESLGFFIDDQWVINDRITLNLGLRYDEMSSKYGTGYVYEFFDDPSDVNNPTVLRERAGTDDIYDFKTWSPRIGFAWDLTGDGKTVLRGHYGRYFFPLGVESLRRFGPDMADTVTDVYRYLLTWDQVDLNGNGVVDFNETRPATALLHDVGGTLHHTNIDNPSWDLQVEDGTTSPYTDQFNLSIQRQLSNDLAIEFSYIYKQTKDFLVLKPYDPNTGEYYEWESMPYTTSTGYETVVWSIVLEDYNNDGVVNWSGDGGYVSSAGDGRWYRAVNATEFNGEDIQRTYQGLQLVLNKRYSNRWQGLFSINYTDTDGFYPRVVDQNWYIDGPLVMDTPLGSSYNHFQNNLEGPALMTPEWMAKLAGSYTIPVIETDFGFRLRYDSGRALFLVDTLQAYAGWMGDNPPPGTVLTPGWGNDMVAIDPNDPEWLPSTTIVDLSLSKRFRIAEWGGLTLSLDGLNIFNEDSPNRVSYRPGDYGRVYSLVTPSIYRLGVKFDF